MYTRSTHTCIVSVIPDKINMITETTEITGSPEPQVAEIDVVIDLAPSALELIKQNKDKYLSMTIAGIDDTGGAKLVDMARKVVKRARVKVGKRLTEINAPLKEKMAANKEMADSITGELKEIEENLGAKYDQWESEVEAEAERVRIETEAKIKARKARLADLDTFFEPVSETMQQYGKQVCTWENVRYSSDEEFEAMLVPIQAAFDAEQARIRAEIEKKKLAGERLVELTKYGVILTFGSDVLTQYGVEVVDKGFLSEASAEKFDIMLDAVRSTYDHHQERLRRQAEEKAAAEQARKDAEAEAERIRKENDDLKAELARIKAEKEAQQQPVIEPVEEKPEPVAETLPSVEAPAPKQAVAPVVVIGGYVPGSSVAAGSMSIKPAIEPTTEPVVEKTLTMREKVVALVLAERSRQTAIHGKQDMPIEDWLLVLNEEMGELAKEFLEFNNPENMLTEAVQVAAVAVQIYQWGHGCYFEREISPADVLDSWFVSPEDGNMVKTYASMFMQMGAAFIACQSSGSYTLHMGHMVKTACNIVYQISIQQQG